MLSANRPPVSRTAMNWETLEHPRDGASMVLVPAGPFLMGLPDSDFLAEEHEKPQRTVELSAFWIDLYPVSNARFRRFLEAGGYDDPQWWSPAGWQWRCQERITQPAQWGQAGWDGHDQPVAGVSWYEADAYARWAGRRLPTDAEWEKAARGSDGRRYPWGNDWPSPTVANFAMHLGRTSPVGLFPAGVSPYGCHDMAGNVNNWTSDWYWPPFGRYCVEHGLLRDPQLDDMLREQLGPGRITEKVDRGGGFATPREFHEVIGCTRKVHWPPETREPWNGFRTAQGTTP
jgi:formylglycine-generating enzyme required for sulfatase activity